MKHEDVARKAESLSAEIKGINYFNGADIIYVWPIWVEFMQGDVRLARAAQAYYLRYVSKCKTYLWLTCVIANVMA